MSRDFIFRIKEGQPLPPVDPSGHRVLLDERTGLFKLLTSTGEVIEAPGAAAASTSEYTETIINITSATTTYSDGRDAVASGILAMGTTPIELLPAPGVGMYYDIEKIVLECKMQGTDYVVDAGSYLYVSDGIRAYVTAQLIRPNSLGEDAYSIMRFSPDYDSTDGIPMLSNLAINRVVTLDYYSESGITPSPTTGTATLRIKIYHKKITLGA